MTKICPRCHITFQCRADNILECECMYVPLSPEDHQYISGQYSDCLCVSCLHELKKMRIKTPVEMNRN